MNLVLSLQVKKETTTTETLQNEMMFQNLYHSKKVKFKSNEQHEKRCTTTGQGNSNEPGHIEGRGRSGDQATWLPMRSLMSRNARDDKNGRFGERAAQLTMLAN